MSATPVLLQAQALSFSYPQRPVFTAWSAEVGPGVTWLRGPNGSGKSTLLKLLAGALLPLDGNLRAAGVDAAASPRDYRRQVFWCGPGAPVFDHLSAQEFFGFMKGLYPSWDDAALLDAVQGLALAPQARRRLADLSTGTQRKVWLAAACAVATPVMLLDEPFNALDAASLAWLFGRLQQAAAGPQAWLVASHREPLGTPGACALIDLESPSGP